MGRRSAVLDIKVWVSKEGQRKNIRPLDCCRAIRHNCWPMGQRGYLTFNLWVKRGCYVMLCYVMFHRRKKTAHVCIRARDLQSATDDHWNWRRRLRSASSHKLIVRPSVDRVCTSSMHRLARQRQLCIIIASF